MSEHEQRKHEVRVHIDQQAHHSPNQTTGEALYKLGKVRPGQALYREVTGDREDAVIPNDSAAVHVREDEHFHSGAPMEKHEVTIIVNGTPHEWPRGEISYAQVVTLDVPDYAKHPEITYSVKYKHGPAHKREGTLSPDTSVQVKDGMVFSVSPTGQS